MLLNPYRFGPPLSSAHAHWRVLINTSMHAGYVAIAELSIRATAGGSNQCSGGTPSASGEYSSTFSAAKAFDANNATQWAKSGVAGSWLRYSFAAPVDCVEIAITSDNGGFAGNVAPTGFTVQYSDDGVVWTSSWSVTNFPIYSYGQTTVYTKP